MCVVVVATQSQTQSTDDARWVSRAESEHTSGRIFGQDHRDYKEVYGINAAHFIINYVFLADKFYQKIILTNIVHISYVTTMLERN